MKPETFYRSLLEQIASDRRRTRARRIAESGLVFWDQIYKESKALEVKSGEKNKPKVK